MFFEKKSQCRKKLKDPLFSPAIVCYAKIASTVQFLGPKRSDLTAQNFVELCRTILVSSCGLKRKSR